MEEAKEQQIQPEVGLVELKPTPLDLLKNYIDPVDNVYLLDRIKQVETENLVLVRKIKNKVKERKNSWQTYEEELERNLSSIEEYRKQMTRSLFRNAGRSNVVNILTLYENKPCVVASLMENLMGMFIIRGKIKSFAFVVQNNNFHIGGYSYKIGILEDKEFFDFFEKAQNNSKTHSESIKIYDQNLFEQLKKEMIVKNIVGKN